MKKQKFPLKVVRKKLCLSANLFILNVNMKIILNYYLCILHFEVSSSLLYTSWPKSHFTILKANTTKPNGDKKIGYVSNERQDLGVFFIDKKKFIV